MGAVWGCTGTSVEVPKKLPHNCHAILQEADSPLDSFPTNVLYERLQKGVFLSQKTKKYWVEGNSGLNCFMLFARQLSITWGADERYWGWHSLNETSDVYIEVADLIQVCFFDVTGKFETSHLSPGATYEVAFVVMMKELSNGWNGHPATLKLVCPDGKVQEHTETLSDKPKEIWIELHVGYFVNRGGEIRFIFLQHDDDSWKTGLVMKGAILRPVLPSSS